MSCVGFEPTIPAFERAKTVHVLHRSATVTGECDVNFDIILHEFGSESISEKKSNIKRVLTTNEIICITRHSQTALPPIAF
jgi:hypothetical protein